MPVMPWCLLCFYPRHPRGWRPQQRQQTNDLSCVSIHATLAGGDALFPGHCPGGICFYPRHPRGWRRHNAHIVVALLCVSIHATLAGGDGFFGAFGVANKKFLSTPPSRVATQRGQGVPTPPMFLSTPPSRVATCCIVSWNRRKSSFYPRHPRGWRLTVEYTPLWL